MQTTLSVSDFDIIFISYDEPNAEHNWEDLVSKVPWAKRVHGVKGSDAAHKAAANLSETERFITIDGDNILQLGFFDQTVTIDNSVDLSKTVLSWPSINPINGLLYGNGGIKCWPKQLVLDMKTHENADPSNIRAQVDFCWDINYIAIDKCFSTTHNNTSKLQAFRAGFREGVKMSLDCGSKVSDLNTLARGNLNRLITWMMVGADSHYGIEAILGARMGCYLTAFTDWDFVQVRDFDVINSLWENEVSNNSLDTMMQKINKYGNVIKTQLPIGDILSPEQSKFFKAFDFNPDRQPKTIMSEETFQYDIVMITYNESNADTNWNKLLSRFPRAKRVHGIDGIHHAHKAAAALAKTHMFWVVDGDAEILDSFNFDYIVPKSKQDTVHVWRARNPVNGLEYGYGGVKLLPTVLARCMDTSTADMTTSISEKYKPVMEVSNITKFNTDPFSAWRSGFRECCKLSSKIINRQITSETTARLNIWCTSSTDAPYAKYAQEGAIAGRKYGTENANNAEALVLINDFNWLKEQYIKAKHE